MKKSLRRQHRRGVAVALAFTAPLALFMIAFFLVPLFSLLLRAVWSPEVHEALPRTTPLLMKWNQRDLPDPQIYLLLSQDLLEAKDGGRFGRLSQKLDYDLPGFRTLLNRTVRQISKIRAEGDLQGSTIKHDLIDYDKRWADLDYWRVLTRNLSPLTPSYILAAIDLRQDPNGEVNATPDSEAVYLSILRKTFQISAVVTLAALVLGYPLAYWLTSLPPRRLSIVMLCILIPFWSSVLVRVASWMVLLQREGLVNKLLIASGLTDVPIELLFNRLGVYISMVHILLPVMVLPLYSVMKNIPVTYQNAAISLGSHPFAAFWRIYVPQTLPGIVAGTLLVFIMALGYYIAPMLLGGASDQMLSYYVAYFTNQSVNWGLACALGGLLLVATGLTFAVYRILSSLGLRAAR